MFKSVRVIIWDVDGTLYKAPNLSHEIYESAYKAIEEVLKVPRADAIALFGRIHGTVTLSATEAVSMICHITTAQAAVLTDRYLDRLRFITHDEALIGLFRRLSGYEHYILGNGSKALIIEGLIALGLSQDVFKEIVTSEVVGVNKPNEAGYRYIMEKTGLPPSAHIMVGDRDRVDLETAKRLGMKTCLAWSDTPSRIADATVPAVYDLSRILLT